MKLTAAIGLVFVFSCSAYSMSMTVLGNQIILSGDVIGNEYEQVQGVLLTDRRITTVILRNSNGGEASVSYRIGKLFRDMGLSTAVSGYCVSSCSRMFLGGRNRYFTDDYPPSITQVWLHGHYDRNGNLDREGVARLGLRNFILEYSDGKADPDLVERWINVRFNNGGIHFYNPNLVTWNNASTFMCPGVQPGDALEAAFGCESIKKTALDLGIVTSLDLMHSNDQDKVRMEFILQPPATGFLPVSDLDPSPFQKNQMVLRNYARFLGGLIPKAFAISDDGQYSTWSSARTGDPTALVMARCEADSKQKCTLYAVDGQVIWPGDK